jgi:symplekin
MSAPVLVMPPTELLSTVLNKPEVPPRVKDEPVDPLQMNIDEEEIEYEPDRLNLEVCDPPTHHSQNLFPACHFSCQG